MDFPVLYLKKEQHHQYIFCNSHHYVVQSSACGGRWTAPGWKLWITIYITSEDARECTYIGRLKHDGDVGWVPKWLGWICIYLEMDISSMLNTHIIFNDDKYNFDRVTELRGSWNDNGVIIMIIAMRYNSPLNFMNIASNKVTSLHTMYQY